MSANLKDRAAWEASFLGLFSKQVFHRVPKIPSHIDLHGETAIVTGSSQGLGLECARQLLQLGLTELILAVRSQARGDGAAKQLQTKFPDATIRVWILDMESYDSVREFASRCETLKRLDVVILNAGCGKGSYQRCSGDKGREVTLQVNYLATMLLTILLVPILREKNSVVSGGKKFASTPGRLTIVGSDMALWVKMEEPTGSLLDVLDAEESFDGFEQYGKIKLLLPMFISKLAEIVSADDVIINVVNPSSTRGTALMRESKGQYAAQAFVFLTGIVFGRNLVDGTRQYLHSSLVLGKESHGSFGDWEIRPYPPIMYTEPGQRMTEKLWKETLEELQIGDIERTVAGKK
ncbi:hypothetical protein BHE90_010501 [Fusarium euwallaceae]|uniref:Ketoreductase (KR) domain-containing protein n=1 Tax=Fusarium euwallaceae TaxID=1147111 RepID=A0A430LH62_9HYPO|nr:hypothetical protein BHE90_010501 [Fusarium euwallaceae]